MIKSVRPAARKRNTPTRAVPMFSLPTGEVEPLAYPGEAMAKNEITALFSEPPYIGACAFRRTEKGYNLEIRMALFGVKMAAINEGGHKIGFDICINDNDAGSSP